MQHKQVKLALVGLGNVGRRFLEISRHKGEKLRRRYGLDLVLVGAADSSGAVLSPTGLDVGHLVDLKRQGQGAAAYPHLGQPGLSALDMVRQADADVLVEAAPVNLRDGEPGLSCVRVALGRGMNVVLADKGPLVLAYSELTELAARQGVRMAFSATVAGGLPVVNMGRRDLAGSDVVRMEGILNLTTNYILTRMAEGDSFAQALAQAQADGHAEADPSLDVEGWDAANKLVIIANSVLGIPTTLADVEVTGIRDITPSDMQRAKANQQTIKLIALAERMPNTQYRFSVRPTFLDANHPLAQLSAHQMGVVYHTDINGVIAASIVEEDPMPTAAALLRDVINVRRNL